MANGYICAAKVAYAEMQSFYNFLYSHISVGCCNRGGAVCQAYISKNAAHVLSSKMYVYCNASVQFLVSDAGWFERTVVLLISTVHI